MLDFGETSIEHIYPKNAKAADVDDEMESRKNSICNLTILDPEINSLADNQNFTAKRSVFKASSIALNQEVGKKLKWNLKASLEYERKILEMARHVFAFN
ncbi:HNH endonuclease family protein [Pseudomonas amygdali]